jgi:hypothetical protein
MLYKDMTEQEIEDSVRRIVKDSSSEAEIRARLTALGVPGEPAICLHTPTDEVGVEARNIVVGLGGLVTKGGAMVMIMLWGPTGQVIQL